MTDKLTITVDVTMFIAQTFKCEIDATEDSAGVLITPINEPVPVVRCYTNTGTENMTPEGKQAATLVSSLCAERLAKYFATLASSKVAEISTKNVEVEMSGKSPVDDDEKVN